MAKIALVDGFKISIADSSSKAFKFNPSNKNPTFQKPITLEDGSILLRDAILNREDSITLIDQLLEWWGIESAELMKL